MEDQRPFKVNNFDLLRLLAATEVVFDHYFQQLHIPISHLSKEILYLFPGVPVFFVISGYLISASFERNGNLVNYFRNRALRIFPGLWGCILLTIIVITITGVSFFNKQTITWLPAQLIGVIYTPNFLANYGFGSYNGSLWTIPIELQFYIVLPLCYFFAPKNKVTYWFYGLLILFVTLSLVYHFSHFSPLITKLADYSFVPHFYLFLMGVILQRLRIYKSRFIYNKALYWLLAYLVFYFTAHDLLEANIFNLCQYLFLAFCVLSMAYTLPRAAEKLLRSNDISYGIYIYHGLILTVVVQEKWQENFSVYLLLAITYLAAYLSWIGIEKPFIQKKKKTIRAIPE